MEIIKKNWQQKLISLLLAIFLWSFIIASENPTVSTRLSSIPIVFENSEELEGKGLVISGISQQSVDIIVSGKRNDIVSVTPSHIRVTADLSYLSEGTQKVRVSYSMPDGINLDSYVYNIDVNIEKIIAKDFSVNVRSRGSLQENYILESTTVSPEKITIRGPRSKVDSISNVVTNIELNTLEKDTTLNSEVTAIDSEDNIVQNITYGQQFVNINANILKQSEIEILPKYSGAVSEKYRIISSALNRSKVYVKGPKDIIDKLKTVETQEINIANITQNQRKIVKLSLPTDVVLVNEDQDLYVNFEVESLSSKTLQIPKSNILTTNSGTLNVQIVDEIVPVTIAGFNEELEKMTVKNIKLIVNLQGKLAGNHIIKPTVQFNEDILESEKIESVGNVNVVITN